MREIYLIRHGLPEFPEGKKICIGHTDLHLSTIGKMQAFLVEKYFNDIDISNVFCSRLKRAIQTAEFFNNPIIIDGLEEMNFGVWDGFSFDEIKIQWPKLYEARGKDPFLQPPGAENQEEAFIRFDFALKKILKKTKGNIIIVSHSAIMHAFLSKTLKKELPPGRKLLPYCSISKLNLKNNIITDEYMGKIYNPLLTENLCLQLLNIANTPEHVIKHSKAVAKEAKRIALCLIEKGFNLNIDLITNTALLHDIARTNKNHCTVGKEWIDALGYYKEAEIIGKHCDNYIFENIDELAVLIIADRVVFEDEVVGLNERFKRSAKKFKTDELKKIIDKKFEINKKNIETINQICKQEIIKL